jgi:hypothetical protein
MKIANLIDITPEDIAKLEALGYAGMNVNLATGKIDLVKAEEKNCECGNHEEEECGFCSGNCCGCLYEDECDCDFDEDECDEDNEDEEIKEKLADCADTLAEIIHKIIG